MGDVIGKEYDLTGQELIRSVSRAEMGVFMRCQPDMHPKSFFIVAQPGAGKTGLKSFVINKAQDGGLIPSYVEFNPDDIGVYHEHYHEIMRDYPDESFPILQRFIRPTLDDYLRKKAVDLRTNIVQEGTFASKDGYLQIIDFQKNGGVAPIGKIGPDGKRENKQVKGGYYVEISALAVDRYVSLLSSYEREQFFKENGLPPRVVQPKYHDSSYEKMLDTIDEVEKRGLADKICVYRRGYTENMPTLCTVSGDKRFMSARQAIEHYRKKDRMELMMNSEGYLDRIKILLDKADDPEQKGRILLLKDEFLREKEHYMDVPQY